MQTTQSWAFLATSIRVISNFPIFQILGWFLLGCFHPHCGASEIASCTNDALLSVSHQPWLHEHSATVLFDQSFTSFVLSVFASVFTTDLYTKYQMPYLLFTLLSSHVATDKDPSQFRSIFSGNLQPIATGGKKARGTLLVDIGCCGKRAPLSVSYYNKICGGHIGRAVVRTRCSTGPVYCPSGYTPFRATNLTTTLINFPGPFIGLVGRFSAV